MYVDRLSILTSIDGTELVELVETKLIGGFPSQGKVYATTALVGGSSASIANAVGFGADPTGVLDSTSAINLALSTGLPVFLPKGTYKVTDILTMKDNQRLYGAGPAASVLSIPATFNLSANGVVAVGASSELSDIGFSFYQDTTVSTRGACIQYPWAIYGPSKDRWTVERVRVSAGWNGINMLGNCGGVYLNRLEICALNVGIDIDGPLDFVNIGHVEFWVYGISGSTNIELNVYEDGTTIGLRQGRCDGLAIDVLDLFNTQFVTTSNANNGLLATNIGTLQIDSPGGFVHIGGGYATVSNFYANGPDNVTATYGANRIKVEGSGLLAISTLIMTTSGSARPDILVAGGTLLIRGGRYGNGNLVGFPCISQTSGTVDIQGLRVSTSQTNRTAGIIKQTGGALQLRNCTFGGPGSATGNGLEMATDTAAHYVAGNDFAGWPHSLSFSTQLGYFDFDADGWETLSLAPQFATAGDSSFANLSVTGGWKRNGSKILLNATISFDTNAYTTAAGSFSFNLSSIPTSLDANTPLTLGAVGTVTAAAGVISAQITNVHTINFPIWVSNTGLATITTTNVPASKTGVQFRISGFYRVR